MTSIQEPSQLCVGTPVAEHMSLDLALSGNRVGAADRFGCQIIGRRGRVRGAGHRVEGKASNGACGVVPGLGSHVRSRDDRPDITAPGGKGTLDERTTDTLRLLVGQDEELGQLEQAIAFDRTGKANEPSSGGLDGHIRRRFHRGGCLGVRPSP